MGAPKTSNRWQHETMRTMVQGQQGVQRRSFVGFAHTSTVGRCDTHALGVCNRAYGHVLSDSSKTCQLFTSSNYLCSTAAGRGDHRARLLKACWCVERVCCSVQLKKQTITHVFCTNLSGSKTDAVHRSLGKASQPLIIHPGADRQKQGSRFGCSLRTRGGGCGARARADS